MILEGQTSSLNHIHILPRLRYRPYVRVSYKQSGTVASFTEVNGQKREFQHPVYSYSISFPAVAHQEFAATFTLLIQELLSGEDWFRIWTLKRLRHFYRRLVHLDKIYAEFKQHAEVPYFPAHIFVIDTSCLDYEPKEGIHYQGAYYAHNHSPYTEIDRISQGQPHIVLYSATSWRRMDRRFIHELIHDIQHARNLSITEDERRMLAEARQYVRTSWIPNRFEECLHKVHRI